MATLASLKLVAAKKPTNMPPAAQRRNKLIAKLEQQIHLATAHNKGETYAPMHIKTVTNAAGERVQVSQPKKIKPWWFVSDNGKVCIAIRYGAKVISITPKTNAIEVNSPTALIDAFETVKTAVQAGELDAQLEAASMKLREGFAKQCAECCRFKRQHSPLNTLGDITMRIEEVVDGATQRVNLLKQQAKLAQKRAKEAALRMRMQKAQQSLVKLAAQ